STDPDATSATRRRCSASGVWSSVGHACAPPTRAGSDADNYCVPWRRRQRSTVPAATRTAPAATSSPISRPVNGSDPSAVGPLDGASCDAQATWPTWVPWPPYVEDDELVLVPHVVCDEAASAEALKPPP